MIDAVISLALFFLAALFEIGGGYLVWLWLRENKGVFVSSSNCMVKSKFFMHDKYYRF